MAKVTLQDIANALGMAKSSVSYALRNDPRIPEETRKRVQKTAQELGYKKNPLVAAWMQEMRSGKVGETTSCIACVTSAYDEERFLSLVLRKFL